MDEIIVKGKRPRPGGADDYIRLAIQQQRDYWANHPGGFAGHAVPIFPATPPPPAPTPPVPAGGAKVIPFPKPSAPIPEIVVTAKRAPIGPRFPPGAAGAAGNIATILASAGALYLDYWSQQLLDDIAAGLLQPVVPPPDSPLVTVEPEPIPEVTVTASRAEVLRAQLGVPPLPTFEPWRSPDFPSIPASVPLQIPSPTLTPLEISPPATSPAPRPSAKPALVPSIDPSWQNLPEIRPGPGTQIRLSPAPANPLTNINPVPVPSPMIPTPNAPGLTTVPTVQPVPQTNPQRKCKPCPKPKKDKRRKRCWKKFVEERSYAKWDREIKWQELDCETGRPI